MHGQSASGSKAARNIVATSAKVFVASCSPLMATNTSRAAIVPKSERERGELWLIREVFDPILPAYLYDVSLPIKHMVAYTQEIETRLASELNDTHSVVFGHIADGNLHVC